MAIFKLLSLYRYESFILLVILANCVMLALPGKDTDPELLQSIDKVHILHNKQV